MALIQRTQNPPLKNKYQSYKPFLRIDFEYRCAYCKNREAVEGGSKKFDIDHYKPKNKFPDLVNTYSNLIYSCKECNSSKHKFWPTIIDMSKNQYILNPCNHDFEKHYNMKQAEWRGNTPVALWNIKRLRLNSPKKLQFREDEADACEIINNLTLNQEELEIILSYDKLSVYSRRSAEKDLKNIQKNISILKRKTFEPLD